MKFLKKSTRANPRVTVILLDWSVRESFHLLHYLSQQDVARDLFEIIVIEYYSHTSDAVRCFEKEVDTWLLLEMGQECYYHKHLMYNAGIILSRGDICVICDSDAMVKSGFIRAIVNAFENEAHIVLHIDQFRNVRRDLYPFHYPTFEEVSGEGCINFLDGKTKGVLDKDDGLHARNYGACMCARKEDLIAIGGADEHVDYLGHICGPYDMTFRLVNSGTRERWLDTEFMYHTWHPGQAGVDNHLGPHDGRHLSTTSLRALYTGRRLPYVENPSIYRLRTGTTTDRERLCEALIDRSRTPQWRREFVEGFDRAVAAPSKRTEYMGFVVEQQTDGQYRAQLLAEYSDRPSRGSRTDFEAASLKEVQTRIECTTPVGLRFVVVLLSAYVSAVQIAFHAMRLVGRRFARV